MAKGKRTRTKEETDKQKSRTYKNQTKKYTDLITQFPDSKQKGAWKKNLDYYSLGNKK